MEGPGWGGWVGGGGVRFQGGGATKLGGMKRDEAACPCLLEVLS